MKLEILQMKDLPTQEYLKECIEYDEESGECFWKHRDTSHFSDANISKSWNARFSGKLINYIDKSGKICVRLDKQQYPLHRLIFKMYYGSDPSKFLKHKDNNIINNRISNLYEDDTSATSGKQKISKHNTSGLSGATFNQRQKKWISEITYKSKRYYIGSFDTAEEAHAAYLKASDELKAGTYDKV